LAFPGPLGRKIVGSEVTVDALTVDDLRAHLAEFYVASNMALVIAGNVSGLTVPAESSIPSGTLARGRVVEEPGWEPSRVKFERDLESMQTRMVLGLRTGGRNHPTHEALRVLCYVLNGGMSARIEQKIRDKGLAYDAGSELDTFDNSGMLTLYVITSKDKIQASAAALFELIRGLTDISDEEFQLAKKQVEWHLDYCQDSPMTLLEQISPEVIRDEVPDIEAHRQAIHAVTKDEVINAARVLLESKRVYMACVGSMSAQDKAFIENLVAVYSA
jgi:predicted Zn-dependent peptidase